ncbi:2Fe-2S ferredoxin [Comamonas serinivorans]|uniref:2Fe-2S ferredoxin n=1 Tax=Comamonas serinivorans TaxID=1082851 RepID=A0A1Y0EJZ1_9BURK|nr:2Fe-2S iron-sulfur cluster-binding protein [Comamonas serinivorans]ARU03741.1 2Fe-2S ferredoxin [Comamonas serinivorans]
MPTIHFTSFTGQTQSIDAPENDVLMQAAVRNGVTGIDADCGGQCACATCHVYIDSPWLEQLPAMEAHEDQMLELANERRANSRLSCQIKLTAALDGMQVHTPEGQH